VYTDQLLKLHVFPCCTNRLVPSKLRNVT